MGNLAHSVEHGGLMAKSIGDIYPLAVSGIGDLWYVWDALKGGSCCMLFEQCGDAHNHAAWVRDNLSEEELASAFKLDINRRLNGGGAIVMTADGCVEAYHVYISEVGHVIGDS